MLPWVAVEEDMIVGFQRLSDMKDPIQAEEIV